MGIDKPIEIAEDIYWVGHKIENDPFQCHVYLIKNKDESILIDPGSRITYEHTREKIKKLVDLNDIKYFICHHQDPDIVGCMYDILDEIDSKDKYIVTHWRAWALLKHYNWNIQLYEVEKNGWRLKAGDRKLNFIFTPYMHFPGAFCTFDKKNKILFSSDIFGGFTDDFELFSKDVESCFKSIKPFHEHYIPSNVILNYGLDRIQQYSPINLIAPQHGSIIKKEHIKPVIENLRKLKCGLFGDYVDTREIITLSELNTAMNEIINIIAYDENFFKVIDAIMTILGKFYSIDYIRAYVADDDEENIIVMDSEEKHIRLIEDKTKTRNMLNASYYLKNGGVFYNSSSLHTMFNIKESSYTFPIKDKKDKYHGVCFIAFNYNNINDLTSYLEVMSKFEIPVSMAVLNQKHLFNLENKNKKLYEETIKDPLTGLFNRRYLQLISEQEFARAARFKHNLSLIMLDIDDFKNVNDRYGHYAGDNVLRNIASIIKQNIRSIDIPIRYGGEEFLIILPSTNKESAYMIAERIRQAVNKMKVHFDKNEIGCTISGGVSSTEDIPKNVNYMICLCDERLYKAKQNGKNKIVAE